MTVESVGGYRLVRKLGAGPRAEVFLGHASSAPADETDARSAAIKLYRAETDPASIATEIEALSRGTVAHRLQLRDLATAPDGKPALILERLPRGSLGKFLHDREVLRLGECVTILAPVALTVAQLHEAGVVHGGIRLDTIGFRESGAPALLGFGRAEVLDDPPSIAVLEANSGVAADRLALVAITRATLERTLNTPHELLEWLAGAAGLESFPTLLADRLFDLEAGEPVRFDRIVPRTTPGLPTRVVAPQLALAPSPEHIPRRPALLAGFHLPEWMSDALVARVDSHPVSELRARVVANLRQVRKPLWIVAGGIAAALIVAVAIVPSGGGDSAGAAAPSPTPTIVPLNLGAVGGDDPLAALEELLAARNRCIADLSVLCLDAVDERGSAALADDQALIRSLQDGAEAPTVAITASSPALVERLGNSAILSLGDVPETQPASLLLMKGEAGWRIRTYLDE